MSETLAIHEDRRTEELISIDVTRCTASSRTDDDVLIYCHWHDPIEFIFLERGQAEVTVASRRHEVSAGQGVLVNSGQVHTARALPGSDCVAHAIVLDPRVLEFRQSDSSQERIIAPLIQRRLILPPFLSGEGAGEAEVLAQLREIADASQCDLPGRALHIKACVYKALSLLASHNLLQGPLDSGPDAMRERMASLKNVLSHIDRNSGSPMRISDLSDIACMSESSFHRHFKQLTGKTPVAYVNGIRVAKAIRLMSDEGLSVTEAALEVGLANISYFIRVFRKQTGRTPSSLRR